MSKLTLKSYFKNIYEGVTSTIKGLIITIKYVYKVKEVTIEYPEQRDILPPTSRSKLFNDVDNCIACNQCAAACPVNCIYIASEKRGKDEEIPKASNGNPIRLKLSQYTIDTALCCYCGICTTVCPTGSLAHTKNFEYSTENVLDMKVDYLADEVRSQRDAILAEREADKL